MKMKFRALTITYFMLAVFSPCLAQNIQTSMVAIDVAASSPKMCSCQWVELHLQGYKKQQVGIFAEKDHAGKATSNFRIMDEMIRKEKAYLQRGFVDDVIVIKKFKADTDCMTLFHSIKQQYNNFRMYNILNVDVILSMARR